MRMAHLSAIERERTGSSSRPSVPGKLSPQAAHQLGLAAAAERGGHAALKRLAKVYGVSRQTVVDLREKVELRLHGLFDPDSDPFCAPMLLRVDQAQVNRAIVALRCEGPNSLRDIQAILKACYHLDVGYGYIQQVITQAEHNAAQFLSTLPLTAVSTALFDEVFSQRKPVLSGLDPDSQLLFLLAKRDSRSGSDWAAELKALKTRGFSPEAAITDAALGLSSGLRRVCPDTVQRFDCFHLLRAFFKLDERKEKSAYAALAAAESHRQTHARPKKGANLYQTGQQLRRAEERESRAIAAYDRFHALFREVAEALEFVSLTTLSLHDADQCLNRLLEIASKLQIDRDPRVVKLGVTLENQAPALVDYIRALNADLKAMAEDERERRIITALAALWRIDREEACGLFPWRHHERARLREQLRQALWDVDERRLLPLFIGVMERIERRHRASSLIECLHSVLRPYLVVHKRVTPGALALFAAWWNLHPRTDGRLKGTCPWTYATGTKVRDWLTVLGFPPAAYVH